MNEKQLREEWKKAQVGIPMMGSDAYGKHLGCCGGDYCEGEHNERIADWWLSKFKDYKEGLKKEIKVMKKGKSHPNFLEKDGQRLNDEYDEAIDSVLSLLDSKDK